MNHDKAICEKCGHKMECQKDGHSLTWICDNCGNAVATTYFEKYETDTTIYHVFILSKFTATTKELKLIAEIANCNYIEAKKLIDNAPVEIFSGKAIEVKAIKEKIEAASIDFKIEPEFPY